MSLMRRNVDPFLTMWDPFQSTGGFESIMKRMENLERSILPEMSSKQELWINPSVDFKENDKCLQITAELPGLEKKDVKIDVDDDRRMLTISGECKMNKEEKNEKYFYKERSCGTFKRQFTLPDYVSMDKIKANMCNGLLCIEVPKNEQKMQKSKTRQVTISEQGKTSA